MQGLLSPAEPPTKSPWHHGPSNNDTSISCHQQSLQLSLHGINASQQRYVNLPSPAESSNKTLWHSGQPTTIRQSPATSRALDKVYMASSQTNNDMSISRHQQSLQQSLHGIMGQPTTIRQSPTTIGASDTVSTASLTNQTQYINLPSPAEPSTKSPWHHGTANNDMSISCHQQSLR